MGKNRELLLLMILIVVFQAIFAVAMINLNRGITTFNIGIDTKLENIIIAVLSVLSILRILWAIIKH